MIDTIPYHVALWEAELAWEDDLDLDAILATQPDRSDRPEPRAPLEEFFEPDPLPLWQLGDAEVLAEARTAQRALAAAQARWVRVLAEIDRRGATLREHGVPTASWLASGTTHSGRAARSEVALAARLDTFPQVRQALARGDLSWEQAQAITGGLARLPEDLDATQVTEVADHLVQLAREFAPVALRRLVNHAVTVVAPQVAEDADRQALERAERAQQRDRYLSWRRDEDGSVTLSGRLPAVEGELVINHLTALVGRRRAHDAALFDLETTRPQAFADALAMMVAHHASCDGAQVGGDWAKTVVTLDLAGLLSGVGTATLLASEEPITAGQARRLACAGGLIPLVLGGDSLPLDYGRERRLFSPQQKLAIAHRDRGCAFPGCDRPPGDCDTHHTTPWGMGGTTDLDNGVLLCVPHHLLVEPIPNAPPEEQWSISFDSHGHPQFTGPRTPAGRRLTRQHDRYRIPAAE